MVTITGKQVRKFRHPSTIMKPLPFTIILAALSLFACKEHARQSQQQPAAAQNKKKIEPPLKAVFGYRFIITGDFDGDGRPDTLTEHFISAIDHKEMDKYHYSRADSGWIKYGLADSNRSKKPISILAGNKRVNSLLLDSSGHSLGLAYLKNEGDLDGDGGDEISYVVDWADASSVNFCSVMTYKDHKWRKLYAFQIRDWQIPDLPEINDKFPSKRMYKDIADTTNRRMERELDAFKGFITKLSPNKIKVETFNDIGDSKTAIVNLKKLLKTKKP